MPLRPTNPPQSFARLPHWLLAMLALVSQLALGSIVLPDDAAAGPVAALDALSVMCSPGHAPGHERKPVPHHAADEALCPARVAMALYAVVPTPDLAVPLPSSHAVGRQPWQPFVRGPPAPPRQAALPRGPPTST